MTAMAMGRRRPAQEGAGALSTPEGEREGTIDQVSTARQGTLPGRRDM